MQIGMKETTITFMIDSDSKENWKEHAELKFGGNMSRMIRTAVTQLMSESKSTGYSRAVMKLDDFPSEEIIRRLDEIGEKLDKLKPIPEEEYTFDL